jgi:hypothetical protein
LLLSLDATDAMLMILNTLVWLVALELFGCSGFLCGGIVCVGSKSEKEWKREVAWFFGGINTHFTIAHTYE